MQATAISVTVSRNLRMEDEGSLQFIFHSQVLMSRAISAALESVRSQQIRVAVAQRNEQPSLRVRIGRRMGISLVLDAPLNRQIPRQAVSHIGGRGNAASPKRVADNTRAIKSRKIREEIYPAAKVS